MKFLVILLVMLLALYPIVELTRFIIVCFRYFPDMMAQFRLELALM